MSLFMSLFRRLALLGLICCMMIACAKIGSRVSHDTDFTDYGTFYVVRHTEGEIHIDEMIRDELRKVGLNASSGPPQFQPQDVDVLVTFEDRWMWDITMYLMSLTIEFREADTGILLATGQSYRPSLERRPPEEMVREIMASIFEEEQHAVQGAPSVQSVSPPPGSDASPVSAVRQSMNEDNRYKLCIYPWKIAAGSTSTAWANTKKAFQTVLDTLKHEQHIVLTHCYYKSEIPAMDQEYFSTTDFLPHVDEAKLWTKQNVLMSIEPNTAFVTQMGRQLNVDLGLLVKMERPGAGNVSVAVYLVDINWGTMNKSEDTVYYIVDQQTLKDSVRRHLADYIASPKNR